MRSDCCMEKWALVDFEWSLWQIIAVLTLAYNFVQLPYARFYGCLIPGFAEGLKLEAKIAELIHIFGFLTKDA